jgi:peptidoglycan/LPS O-acetylase OafA/YrhL
VSTAPLRTAASNAAPPAGRLRSLDGLRGLAAVVVLLHHVALVFPSLAEPYFTGRAATPVGSPSWLLTFTPLHLAWAGPEAVYVFFVLSGLVLTRQMSGADRRDWVTYYPRRLARLYLPVAGAVAVGYAIASLVSPSARAGLSPWVTERTDVPSLRGVLHDLTLVRGSSGLITPLWSLQWEVVFSLLLPLFLLAAGVAARLPWLVVTLSLACITWGSHLGRQSLTFLPMFAIGAVLAGQLPTIQARCARWSQGRWLTVVFATGLALVSWWLVAGVAPSHDAVVLTRPVITAGAAGAVVVASAWPPATRFLSSRLLQWAGTISFSLYLVHEPLVVAGARILGPSGRGWLPVVAIPVCLATGWVFWRLVEQPSHQLARRIGRR